MSAAEDEGFGMEGGPRSTEVGVRRTERGGRRPKREGRARWLIVPGALVLLSSAFWGPMVLRHLSFFRVRRVEIVGAHYVVPGDILSRLRVDTTFSVWDPTKPLVARVAAHPEVQSVVIHRKLPGTLIVELVERVPIALVPSNAGFRVYDERGVALPIDPTRIGVDVPVVMQPDARLLRFLGAMRQKRPDFYARVSALQRVGKDEMLLQLGTLPVRAMQDVTFERLAEIEPVEGDLARKQLRVAEIDLRYRDQVIARLQ